MEASQEAVITSLAELRNLKRQERVLSEIAVDPHSPFWLYHQDTDFNDPLAILEAAEAGDENACALMRGEGQTYPLLPRAA